MKEFELTLKIRNNRLLQRREEMGLSAPEVAAKAGVSYGIYNSYESFRVSPIGAIPKCQVVVGWRIFKVFDINNQKFKGFWKNSAKKIAKFYGVNPSELWPDAALQIKKSKT